MASHVVSASVARSLGALGVSFSLQFWHPRHQRDQQQSPLAPAAAAWLAIGVLIGIWLAAITAWWLLAAGALGLGVAWGWATRPAPARLDGYRDVAIVVLFELLASWGTVLVELHHLPWLGLVAAVLPASLAAALKLVTNLPDLPADLATGRAPSHWPRWCRC